MRRVLWLVGEGFELSSKGSRFVVEYGGERAEVAARLIKQVVVVGSGWITSGAMGLAASSEIPVVLADWRTMELDLVAPSRSKRYAELVIKQVDGWVVHREFFGRRFLECFVEGALHAFGKAGVDPPKIPSSSLEEALEAVYEALGEAGEAYEFLRLLCASTCLGELCASGLNPFLGFLHSRGYALAWDFELLFSPPLALYPALLMLRDGVFKRVSVEEDRRFLAQAFDQRLWCEEEWVGARRVPYLRVLEAHVKGFSRSISQGILGYNPFCWGGSRRR